MLNLFRSTFRLWWQKSRPVSKIPEERTVSFLELFYDLAYVVIIIQLTHVLAGHLDANTFFEYIAIYAMAWFAWINGTLYHELHGNNDIRSRVFTFLQMFCLLWMAIFVADAFNADGYQGFALAYGSFLAIVSYMWWRTGVHDPDHRPLSTPYAVAFFSSAVAFLYSTQVSLETAQTMWLVAVLFMLIYPLIAVAPRRKVDAKHLELSQRIRPSLVERFGLLTIIILGENLISIVGGASYVGEFTASDVAMISLSILIVFSLWWVYFDLVSLRVPKQNNKFRMSWVYLHLPLTLSIGLVAVGLLNMIEYVKEPQAVDRWFIVLPSALFLLVVTLLIPTLQVRYKSSIPAYRKASVVAVFSAVCLVLLGFTQADLLVTLVLTWLLLTIPVLAGFTVWIRRRSREIQSS